MMLMNSSFSQKGVTDREIGKFGKYILGSGTGRSGRSGKSVRPSNSDAPQCKSQWKSRQRLPERSSVTEHVPNVKHHV